MALVSQGFEVAVTILGRDGYPYDTVVPLTSADYATAVTDFATWQTRFAAVSDGVISKYVIRQVFQEDALSLASAALNSREVADVTCYVNDEGNKKLTIFIPMPKDAIRVAAIGKARRQVAIGASVLTTYISSYQTGGIATASDGEVAGGIIEGVIASRSLTKGSI